MTEAERAELRRLLAKRTPGELRIERRDNDEGSITYVVHGDAADFASSSEIATDHAKVNADLIVALVNAAPALLDELDRLRATVARVEALVPQWYRDADRLTASFPDEPPLTEVSVACAQGVRMAHLGCAHQLEQALRSAPSDPTQPEEDSRG